MAAARKRRVRSGLGRPLDLRLASNRLVLVVPVVAAAVAGVWALGGGSGAGDALQAAVGAGGASFLAWATGRELDPDHPVTAGAAAVVAPWLVLSADPALAAGFLWMLAIRAVVGSTGAAPYPADMVVIGALAVWVAVGDRGIVAAVGGLAVFAASTVFDRRGRVATLVLSVVGGGVAVAAAMIAGRPLGPVGLIAASGWWMMAIVAVATAALFVRTASSTDRRPRLVSVARLRWGVVVAAASALLAVAWHGVDGVAVVGPVVVALAATAVRVGLGVAASGR